MLRHHSVSTESESLLVYACRFYKEMGTLGLARQHSWERLPDLAT